MLFIIVPSVVSIFTEKDKLASVGFLSAGISDDRKFDREKGKHTIYLDAAGGFGGISITDKSTKH